MKLTLEEMEKLDFFYDEKEKKEYLDQLRSQRKQAGKAKDSKAEEALI